MRYVVVSVLNGEIGEFNNNLRKEVWQRFKAKSSKLPAHFTIKAPFEYEGDISELEEGLKEFVSREKAVYFDIVGYDHFYNKVIYMKANMSIEGKAMHDKLIDRMSLVEYIKFNKKDGKDKIFHVTIVSKNINSNYDEIWRYVNNNLCVFKNCLFDNITIYKWEDNTWRVYNEFKLNRT